MRQMLQYRNIFPALAFILLSCAFSAPVMSADKCPVTDAAVEKAGGFANAVTAAVKIAWSCGGACG